VKDKTIWKCTNIKEKWLNNGWKDIFMNDINFDIKKFLNKYLAKMNMDL
jgi:hypothetical protein